MQLSIQTEPSPYSSFNLYSLDALNEEQGAFKKLAKGQLGRASIKFFIQKGIIRSNTCGYRRTTTAKFAQLCIQIG